MRAAPFWLEETAPFDPAKHPRAGKGPAGGQFTKGQQQQQQRDQEKKDVKARAAAQTGKRRLPKQVPRSPLMPKPVTADGRVPLPKRKRTPGRPKMVIAASDQAPLKAADDPAKMAALIAKAKGLGITHWRLVMEWGQVVNPDTGELDFSQYRKTVDALKAAGISTELAVLGTASYHPNWDQQLSAANPDPGKARWFAQQVGRAFQDVGKVSAWNEPNYPTFGAMSPEQYRRVYQAMRDGFRAGNPKVSVGFGEVAPIPGADAWLHASLRGAKRVDRVTLHTYQAGSEPPTNYSSQPDTLGINALDYAQAVIKSTRVKNHKGRVPGVDITEMGYTGEDPQRAPKLSQAIKQANSRDAGQFTFYGLFGGVPNPGVAATAATSSADDYGNVTVTPGTPGRKADSPWDTSLIDANGNPTPAYFAAQAAVKAISARPKKKRKAASRSRVREDAFWL